MGETYTKISHNTKTSAGKMSSTAHFVTIQLCMQVEMAPSYSCGCFSDHATNLNIFADQSPTVISHGSSHLQQWAKQKAA